MTAERNADHRDVNSVLAQATQTDPVLYSVTDFSKLNPFHFFSPLCSDCVQLSL